MIAGTWARGRAWLRRSAWLRTRVQAVRHWRGMRRLEGPRLIARFARLYPRAFFIQIGANDGEQLDPLRRAVLRRPWRGIMVEPVPFVFERLRRNAEPFRDRVALENVAIAGRNGELPFWHLREAAPGEDLPRWYDALGSFHKEVVLKHAQWIPDIEKRLVRTSVPCVTFDALCRRHGVTSVDLVQIDTEGYDFEIIKLIDFERWRPVLLIYEHHHFDPAQRAACRRHLAERGYALYEEGLDTWCLDLHDPDRRRRRMIRYWRRRTGRA